MHYRLTVGGSFSWMARAAKLKQAEMNILIKMFLALLTFFVAVAALSIFQSVGDWRFPLAAGIAIFVVGVLIGR